MARLASQRYTSFVKFFVGFLLISLPFCSQPRAAPALPITLAFEDKFRPEFEKTLEQIVQSALMFVATFPPSNLPRHAFEWGGDRTLLVGKTLTITLANSNSAFVDIIRKGPGGMPPDLDAVTLAPIDVKRRIMPIYTVLFVDKLFYEFGRERPDAFARAVIALAHEFYGNVQRFLLMDLANPKPMTFKMRVEGEVEAFSASVRFLEELKANPVFSTLPESIREKVVQQLPREKKGLESWQEALRSCRGPFN